ncbi:MAG: sulfatase-like hydrolase/transferase [Myxococcota bacterium]
MPRWLRAPSRRAVFAAWIPAVVVLEDGLGGAWLGGPGVSFRARLGVLGAALLAVMLAALVVAIGTVIAGRSRRGRALLGAAVSTATAAVATQHIGDGPWISAQWWGGSVMWLLAAAAGVATHGWLTVATRWSEARSAGGPRRLRHAAVLVAPAIVLPCLDTGFEPARFRDVHLWLAAANVVCWVGLARVFADASAPTKASATRLAAIVVPTAFGVAGVTVVAQVGERLRAEWLVGSPTLGRVLRTIGGRSSGRLTAALRADPLPPWPTAPATGPKLPEASVLFITVDALRADALWPVADAQSPTAATDAPFLDGWVRDGVVFRRAYAPASVTSVSVPLIFHAEHRTENPAYFGTKLGPRMRATGRRTIAVTWDWFEAERAWMLEGFDVTRPYGYDGQARAVDELLAAVDAAPGPFFAWLHLSAVHAPGFDGHTLRRSDGPWPERYRRGLRWADDQLRVLHDALHRRDLLTSTIIVLTADHGEGLGDHGVPKHGASVFEAEVRVPLVWFVPAQPPRVVASAAGVIDVIPTLLALLAVEPDPTVAGRSLAPAIAGHPLPARDYPLLNRSARVVGLVRETDKIIYDDEADVVLRFDLETDPREAHNLFGAPGGSAVDATMLTGLVHAFPQYFAAELADPELAALLGLRIDALGPDSSRPELEFVTGLAVADGRTAFLDGLQAATRRLDARRAALIERRVRWPPQVSTASR